jgi:hypothetical protein
MAKYSPLQRFLAGLPNEQREITLTFEKIEQIIGEKLPKSAFLYRAWWSNKKDGVHVVAHSWLNAGWFVDSVDQSQHWVRFMRKVR